MHLQYVVREARYSDIPEIQRLDHIGLGNLSKVSDRWHHDHIKDHGDLYFVAELVDAPGTLASFGNGVPIQDHSMGKKHHPAFENLDGCGVLSRGVTDVPYRRRGIMRNIVEHINQGFCNRGLDYYSVSTFRRSNELSTAFHVGVGYVVDYERSGPYYDNAPTEADRYMMVVKKPLPCNPYI